MVVDFLPRGGKGGSSDRYVEKEVPIALPYKVACGGIIEWDGELHLFGGEGYDDATGDDYNSYHYKFDGIKWIKLEKMPGQYSGQWAYGSSYCEYSPPVIYNNKVLIPLYNYSEHQLYEWDGLNWSKSSINFIEYIESTEEYDNDQINFVFNGALHAVHNNKDHYYDEDNSEWVELSTIPVADYVGDGYRTIYPSICIYNNKIHYFVTVYKNSDNKIHLHYECGADGVWSSSFSVPASSTYGATVVSCAGKLLYLEREYSNNCYFYDNGVWKFYTAMPYPIPTSSPFGVGTCGNKVYMVGGDYGDQWDTRDAFYVLDAAADQNVQWEKMNDYLPAAVNYTPVITFNNEIYIGTDYDDSDPEEGFCFYRISNGSFVKAMALPDGITSNYSAVVFNNEIHVLFDTYHSKWDGSSWISVSTLPHNIQCGLAVVAGNEIHILGGTAYGDQTKHYKWNGTDWVSVSTLPYRMYRGRAVVLNDEIHILGSSVYNSGNQKPGHYKWNGTSWVKIDVEVDYVKNNPVVVYDGGIHIFGMGDDYTEITIGGGTDCYKNYRTHFIWNGSEFKEFSYLSGEVTDLDHDYDYPIVGGVCGGDFYIIQGNVVYHLPASEYQRAKQNELASFRKVTAKLYEKLTS